MLHWIKELGLDDKTMNRKTEDNLIINACEMKSEVTQTKFFTFMRKDFPR